MVEHLELKFLDISCRVGYFIENLDLNIEIQGDSIRMKLLFLVLNFAGFVATLEAFILKGILIIFLAEKLIILYYIWVP